MDAFSPFSGPVSLAKELSGCHRSDISGTVLRHHGKKLPKEERVLCFGLVYSNTS